MTVKVAVVTGAGSGMGQLAAWHLAEQGAHVAALDIDDAGLTTTAARDGVTPMTVDVTDRAAVERAVKQVGAELGEIDRVMNAAGIARVGPLAEQDPEDIMRLMTINYGGTVLVNAAIVPGMLERGRGEVVNFASLAGWIPQAKMGAYCATKFALVAYSEALWMENRARGLKIACVCPPAVATPMLPDFFAQPEKRKKAMAIPPEAVVAAIEKALAKNRFLVLPHLSGKALWRVRRHTPRLLRRVLAAERFDLI